MISLKQTPHHFASDAEFVVSFSDGTLKDLTILAKILERKGCHRRFRKQSPRRHA